MKFDSKQKRDGFNKHNHYQFGSDRCQYCKGNSAIKGTVICESCKNNKK